MTNVFQVPFPAMRSNYLPAFLQYKTCSENTTKPLIMLENELDWRRIVFSLWALRQAQENL